MEETALVCAVDVVLTSPIADLDTDSLATVATQVDITGVVWVTERVRASLSSVEAVVHVTGNEHSLSQPIVWESEVVVGEIPSLILPPLLDKGAHTCTA